MAERNPYSAPEKPATGTARRTTAWMTPTGWFCLGYYAIAVATGARSAVVWERTAGDLVFNVALAICLGTWALADARQRQKPISRSNRLWFFILAGLVVPGYVIATRHWKGLAWVVFHILGWLVISTLAMHITGFIYFGDEWWRALGAE